MLFRSSGVHLCCRYEWWVGGVAGWGSGGDDPPTSGILGGVEELGSLLGVEVFGGWVDGVCGVVLGRVYVEDSDG